MQKGIYYSFLPGETPEEVFANAKAIGFDCVEIPTLRTDDERRRYKAAADAAGIRIPSIMNSDHWGVPLSDAAPAVRAKGIDCLRQSLETARIEVEQAKENLQTVIEQYKLGEASRVDFTDAAGSYASALGARVKAFYAGEIAEAALIRLTGVVPPRN